MKVVCFCKAKKLRVANFLLLFYNVQKISMGDALPRRGGSFLLFSAVFLSESLGSEVLLAFPLLASPAFSALAQNAERRQ